MKRNIFSFTLMAAIVCGLGMSIVSCEDDDKLSSEEKKAQEEQKAVEKATAFWDVVSQLVSIDDVTDDYKDKTFEPTYGMPDPTNDVTRIVNTNDMKSAAQRFANLVGVTDIDENTSSYKWSDPEIGSMTYTRGGTAANWATVDVDIKQIPHLQKIIYREGGEGDNGKFSGKAYYRFGDVVSRQVTVNYDQKKNNDNRGTITEYWICVRPAFGPEGKEDSHWVCVNTVSDKNYKYYKASTGTEYWLPTKLGTDKENMQNFAELLWAITHSEQWFNNVFNHHTDGTFWGFDGVPFFTDFKGANLKYHNEAFWKNVQNGWEKKEIAQKALNLPDIGTLADLIYSNGVRLLYWGYSWIFTTSWDCELHEAIYTNGSTDAELNMHHAEYKEDWDVNMKNIKFDVRAMGKNKENYKDYFNNDGKTRWVIRHATGKELAANKKYDVKQPINGVEEVYRYYRDVVPVTDLSTNPETTDSPNAGVNNDPAKWNLSEYSGYAYYEHGDVLTDNNGHHWFVINQAGNPDFGNDKGEKMPFAELVSFEGITFSSDNKTATNLPTRDEAIRAAFRLDMFFTQTAGTPGYKKGTKQDWISNGKYPKWGCSLYNVLDYANVDMRDLFQLITAQSGDPRQGTHAASIAYNDGSDRMRLLRYITNNQNERQDFKYYLWDHYVSSPDSTTLLYPDYAYSNVPIYLQDLTDQQKVNAYAEDTYARQGLSSADPITCDGSQARRKARTTTDARASYANNCVYNINTWHSRTFLSDMWNEPILMFRFTRIYDRGATDHATQTVKGLTLTRIKQHEWPDPDGDGADENRDAFRNQDMSVQYKNVITSGDWKLDGKDITFPTWQQLYK